jgi:hypothetical protein
MRLHGLKSTDVIECGKQCSASNRISVEKCRLLSQMRPIKVCTRKILEEENSAKLTLFAEILLKTFAVFRAASKYDNPMLTAKLLVTICLGRIRRGAQKI